MVLRVTLVKVCCGPLLATAVIPPAKGQLPPGNVTTCDSCEDCTAKLDGRFSTVLLAADNGNCDDLEIRGLHVTHLTVANCDQVTIAANVVQNGDGINLYQVTESIIIDNEVRSCRRGMTIYPSVAGNVFGGNLIRDTVTGLAMLGQSNVLMSRSPLALVADLLSHTAVSSDGLPFLLIL